MGVREDIQARCDWCDAAIFYGNAQVVVARNVEQVDRSHAHPEGEVTVIDSDILLTLCAPCGNGLDGEELRRALAR